MTLWCENKAAGISAEIDSGNKLRLIIKIKHDHIKECVKRNLIKVKWVSSKDQIADVLTKPLPFDSHKKLISKIMNTEN